MKNTVETAISKEKYNKYKNKPTFPFVKDGSNIIYIRRKEIKKSSKEKAYSYSAFTICSAFKVVESYIDIDTGESSLKLQIITKSDSKKSNENSNENSDENSNENSNENSDENTDENSDENTDENTDENSNENSNVNSDENSNVNSDENSNENRNKKRNKKSNENYNEKVFSADILSRTGCKELLRFGVHFHEKNIDDVIDYLLKSKELAPKFRSYKKLGWIIIGGKEVFKSHSIIAPEDSSITGEYLGNLVLKPKGSLETWLAMVRNQVLDKVPLTVVMLLGFASVILGYLNQKMDLGSLLFSLANNSSKGKTTAIMLAASVCSNPEKSNGTHETFNTTKNALITFISQCHSHTVALDEAVMSEAGEISKLLYEVCSGNEKMRLDADGQLKKRESFSSVIISTAEFNLIDDTSPDGLRARVFEIGDDLTDSAKNSDVIKNTVKENYGFVGDKFVHFLIDHKMNDILKDYEKSKKGLVEKCTEKKHLTERILSKFAVVLLTAEYFKECFNIDIDIDEIEKYLLTLEHRIAQAQPIEDQVLDLILQEISKNGHKYIFDNDDHTKESVSGLIKDEGSYRICYLLKGEVERLLNVNNISSITQVLKRLKAQGRLICENDRMTKRVTLSKKAGVQICYGFKIKREDIGSNEPTLPQNSVEHYTTIEESDLDF